ncbi:MAG: amidohydrolase [Hyphomicrobiales bacterium]|nr:amidohydrolase [Hyphomicrobiales bacterium]
MASVSDICRLSGCACHPSRRGFIAVAAATATGGAKAQDATPKPPHRVDVHHHILPPQYVAVARDRLLSFAPNYASVLNWTPAQSIEQMDRFGIRTAMTSLSNPGTWFGKAEEARSLARMSNEYAAQMARDYPGRFGVLASLSLPDVEGSLKEIAYAYDVLKVDGIAMLTSYGDRWPGDEAFTPAFEELNRRGATVYFHPTSADCCSALIKDVPAPAVEYMFDTTRAITSLLFSGALSRWRNISFIFSHAGGATAPIVDRIIRLATIDKTLAARMPDGPAADLKRLYFDTATSTGPENLGAIMKLVGAEKILLGTDYPFLPIQATLPGLAKIGFDAQTLQRVERDNAVQLFPRLRT